MTRTETAREIWDAARRVIQERGEEDGRGAILAAHDGMQLAMYLAEDGLVVDVWAGRKVFGCARFDEDGFRIRSFKRGAWEHRLIGYCPAGAVLH
jgi:hypothetical protein